MSAGPFVNVKYEADGGDVHFVSVQPETVAATINGATNAASVDPATSDFWFEVNRGANEYGGRPRKIRVKWQATGAPAGYQESASVTIPVLTAAVFNGCSVGDTVVYLGSNATITRKITENIYPGI